MSRAITRRSYRGHRQVAWIGALLLVSACSDLPEGTQGSSNGGTEPPPGSANSGTGSLPATRALISAPTADLVSAAVVGIGLAYVSMTPGTEPGGDSVAIQRLGGGPSVGTRITDGGFDPVAVEANAGDTLAISVLHENAATDTTYGVVPIKGRPTMVRTSPPAGRTDVPLNSVILVVFNEPMDSTSLSDALHLRLHGVDVSGIVTGTPLGGVILSGEFVPTSPLDPGSTYEIFVSTAARDLSGTPLNSPVQSAFSTAGTSSGQQSTDPSVTQIEVWDPPSSIGVGETASLQAWPNGAGIGRIRPKGHILWNDTDESIAMVAPINEPASYDGVDFFARLYGIAEGTVTITAAADGITATFIVTVGRPAASIAVYPTTRTLSAARCQSVQLNAVLHDASGAQLLGRRPVWSSSSSSAYVDPITGRVFAADSGTATITATTGLVAASAVITVVGHTRWRYDPLCS